MPNTRLLCFHKRWSSFVYLTVQVTTSLINNWIAIKKKSCIKAMNLTCPILFSSVQKKKKRATKQVEKSMSSNFRRTNRIQAGVEMTVFKRGFSQVHVNCQHKVTLRQNVSIWPVSTWLMIGVSSTQKKQDPASKDAQTARGSFLQPSCFFFPF